MEEVLGTCLDRGIKVVANAGGLNPAGLRRRRCGALATRLGLHRRRRLRRGRRPAPTGSTSCSAPATPLAHLDTGAAARARPGRRRSRPTPTSAAGASSRRSAAGADVVVCRRVTDASLVVGPAAWYFGWARDDWDALAGAVVAGHVIECGAAGHRRQLRLLRRRCPTSSTRASRSPRCAADGIARHHQAPGHRRAGLGRHRHRAAALRDRRARPTRTPTSSRASTPSGSTAGRARPGARSAGTRGSRRRPRQGGHQLPRRLPQLDDVRAHRPRHRGQGRAGRGDAVRRCSAAATQLRRRSTCG